LTEKFYAEHLCDFRLFSHSKAIFSYQSFLSKLYKLIVFLINLQTIKKFRYSLEIYGSILFF
jgi:hypothetical protein